MGPSPKRTPTSSEPTTYFASFPLAAESPTLLSADVDTESPAEYSSGDPLAIASVVAAMARDGSAKSPVAAPPKHRDSKEVMA